MRLQESEAVNYLLTQQQIAALEEQRNDLLARVREIDSMLEKLRQRVRSLAVLPADAAAYPSSS